MRLLAAILVVMACWAWPLPPVMAHDIGVSQVELTEASPAQPAPPQRLRYTLSVRTDAIASHLFTAPLLPEHCGFIDNPGGSQSSTRKTFVFGCRGGLTAADTIELPWQRDGILLTANWLDGSTAKGLFSNHAGRIRVPLLELQAGSGSWLGVAQRYTKLGIEHILTGFDHLLFVLCLLLIVHGGWRLVRTITAFTLAHSITLVLASLGVINLPSAPVEASIALSIAFLAAEILRHHAGTDTGWTYRSPWLVAFAFGLLHGLGFAGALTDIGLPQGEVPVALLFFNIGVELGQLVFVALVLLLLALLRPIWQSTHRRVELAASYAIGTVAMYWLFERVGGMVIPA